MRWRRAKDLATRFERTSTKTDRERMALSEYSRQRARLHWAESSASPLCSVPRRLDRRADDDLLQFPEETYGDTDHRGGGRLDDPVVARALVILARLEQDRVAIDERDFVRRALVHDRRPCSYRSRRRDQAGLGRGDRAARGTSLTARDQ